MWLREVSKYGGESLQNSTVIIGNKSDLKAKKVINKDEGDSWAK
jgi:hypothetical protein